MRCHHGQHRYGTPAWAADLYVRCLRHGGKHGKYLRQTRWSSLLYPGAMAMQITFIRTSERDYAIRCTCDDGAVLAVRTYDRPLGLPHDLAHYVVRGPYTASPP